VTKKPQRPVDDAMQEVRPEKVAVRNLWIKVLKEYDGRFSNPKDLLYVTLAGSDGYDIELLGDHNLIQRTETGGIAQESMLRVAAVESSSLAVGMLQRKFPGLKIYQTDFKGLIRGDGLISYPSGEHKDCCRARIINLDLNATLGVRDDETTFPILVWIQKLGEIHASAPRLEWCLYLTLHGEVHWSQSVNAFVRHFLRENFSRAQGFAALAQKILGEALFNEINGGNVIDFSIIKRELQQKLLMAFVPKKIADLVRAQMWRLETRANLRYGQVGHAPMVTWIMDFKHDPRAAGTPDAVYLESLDQVLNAAGQINDKGVVVPDNREM
jgi:hypothetical protein